MTDDKTQQCVILWCRRDLRLDDNPALSEALRNADVVVCTCIQLFVMLCLGEMNELKMLCLFTDTRISLGA